MTKGEKREGGRREVRERERERARRERMGQPCPNPTPIFLKNSQTRNRLVKRRGGKRLKIFWQTRPCPDPLSFEIRSMA